MVREGVEVSQEGKRDARKKCTTKRASWGKEVNRGVEQASVSQSGGASSRPSCTNEGV